MSSEAISPVMVTGGSGRLGRSIVDHFREAGVEVVSVDLVSRTLQGSEQQFPADLDRAGEAYAAVSQIRPKTLIHLAAIAEPFSAPETTIVRTNVSLAYNTLQAAVDLGAERVVVAGSPTVIGYGLETWSPQYLPLDEGHPAEPWHGYGVSKLLTEEIVRSFVRQTLGRVRFAIFRPSFVVTPEEWAGAEIQGGGTIRDRLNSVEIAGSNLFGYVDSRDAAALVERLVYSMDGDGGPNGEVYFCAAADALAKRPLAELIPEIYPSIADRASALTDTRPAIDCSKARALGWRPRHSWRHELPNEAVRQ